MRNLTVRQKKGRGRNFQQGGEETDGWKEQRTIRSAVRRVAKLNRAKFIEFRDRARKRRCPRETKKRKKEKEEKEESLDPERGISGTASR